MMSYVTLLAPNFFLDAGKARSMALKMIDVSDAGGYMGTSSGSGLIDLSVEFLNGEGC